MIRWLAFIVLLPACAPDSRLQGVPCKTSCGVRLFGSNDCAGFQVAEDRAVAVYSRHYPAACDALYGFVVYIQPAPGTERSWQSPAGRTVRGLTWCRSEVIQLGSDDWSRSSYAHETLHAVECGLYLPGEDPDQLWEASWQPEAVAEAQR